MKNYGCDKINLDLSKVDFNFLVSTSEDDNSVSIVLGSDNSIFTINISKVNARELSDSICSYFGD